MHVFLPAPIADGTDGIARNDVTGINARRACLLQAERGQKARMGDTSRREAVRELSPVCRQS